MKILYHHRTRAEDAQGIHIAALVRAFRDLGHQVELVGPADPTRKKQAPARDREAAKAGNSVAGRTIPHWLYELLAIGYNLPAFLVLCWKMARSRPDLVYERYALFNVSGRLASALFGVPFVLEVNAPLSLEMKKHEDLVFRRLAQAVEDWMCKHATKTVVVTEAMARIFEQRGVPRERLMVVHNGVDRRKFRADIDGSPIREKAGLQGRFVIGFVGWVRPWHGVDVLLRASASLMDRFDDLSVLIVGDGPALPDLRKLADELDIADRVVFTGAVALDEVPGYIAAMDVAVQPDVTEYASPIKLFEYLAMARAVVAPSRSNIIEVVGDSEHAILFEPGNVEDLANALRTLREDDGRREALARSAVELVEERGYYWEGNAQRVLDAAGLRGG